MDPRTDKLRAAVIGAGSIGQHHARVYSELAQAHLVAVADVSEPVVARVVARYGARAYSDYQAMLERERPDIVSVSVPTSLHREVAAQAMQAGAHVLVEKPIAATIEEGQALIDIAHSLNRHLMVGHIVRFNPAIQALKTHLAAGEIGRIFQILCRRVGPFPDRIRDVGVVIDLAPHDLDVMRFLSGDEPVRVYAEIEQHIHTQSEDSLMALLRFRSGISGMLDVNWLTPVKAREVLVLGEQGMFRVDDLMQDLYFYENAQASTQIWSALRVLRGVSEGRMIRYPISRYEPLKAELEAFVNAVLEDKPMPVTGEDGLAALRLALALVESGETHQVIEIKS